MAKYLLILLFISGIAKAQIVNIPDTAFKQLLITSDSLNLGSGGLYIRGSNGNGLTLDLNNDQEIQESEALRVYDLGTLYTSITNFVGLEKFTNITRLSLTYTSVSNFDMSTLTNLKEFELWYWSPNLSRLDFSNCKKIELVKFMMGSDIDSLILPINNISLNGVNLISNTTLDVKYLDLNNRNMKSISFESTNLNFLDISNNPLLTNIRVEGFRGANFTPVGVPNLKTISLYGYYYLESIVNFSNCPSLESLTLDVSSVKKLDLSSNPKLKYLDLGSFSNLIYLNLKNGTSHSTLLGYGLAAYKKAYVCADDWEISALKSKFGNNLSDTVYISSYCNFTPGGIFNTINGSVYLDINANGCDSTDKLIPYQQIAISDSTNSGSTFSNASGQYTFYSNAINNNLTVQLQNPTYFSASPATIAVGFPAVNNLTQTQNFCLSSVGVFNDVEVYLSSVPARPGFDSGYELVYKNKGNQVLSGSVNVTFDDLRSDFIASTPALASQVSNLLNWNYSNLLPFESRKIYFTLNINSPMDTPAVNAGDTLNFVASVNPTTNDVTPLDNSFTFNQTVVNAFDPNDITCLEGDVVLPSEIGKYLHYKIRFENVGTAEAINIVVKDLIDTLKYDIKSLQFLSASHPVETKITKNKVEFIFENINLPSSSVDSIGGHGSVFFKVKTLPTLVVGAVVSNSANIYFDYNFPIETNDANTSFATLVGLNNVNLDKTLLLFPNPVSSFVNVKSDFIIKSIDLYDALGRIIETSLINQKVGIINMENKSKGIYYLKVKTAQGSNLEKIIKE